MTSVDLNADLGEGVSGDPDIDPVLLDELLLREVTSANVACGGHAGDDTSMARVCSSAVRGGVAIGAQASYVDRSGFGRARIDVAHPTLVAQLVAQLAALRTHAVAAGGTVSYVKPHGALYNTAADDADVARSVVQAVLRDAESTGVTLPVLTLPGCALAVVATAHGLDVVGEAFADRAYTLDGRLVPRSLPGAVLADADVVRERVLRLATHGVLRTIDGADIAVGARSICLHSDTPGAAATAAAVRRALTAAGVTVKSFVDTP